MATEYAETVAASLIKQLKDGTAPWVTPWQPSQHRFLPYNAVTGKDYRNGNAVWLMAVAHMSGYADPRWTTYKQAQSIGAQVNKGEHGTLIQYFKTAERMRAKDDQGKPLKDAEGNQAYHTVALQRPRIFSAVVFNAAQISGLPERQERPVLPEWERHQEAETIMKNSGVPIIYTPGNRAFYSLSRDRITLPEREQFPAADRFYATTLHEIGHSTGHPSRLNRPDLGAPFGSEAYAREELRAEIASLMIGDKLGVGHDPSQHAAYVGSWIEALQKDPYEIFRASRDAEKIAGYVIGLRQEQKAEQVPVKAEVHTELNAYWQERIEHGKALRAAREAALPESSEREGHKAAIHR